MQLEELYDTWKQEGCTQGSMASVSAIVSRIARDVLNV
uniref:Uncharacterized protein n=1 Tax=Bracon brevicornis TaxID=1563983 RepID=A0A6V7ILN0_9HYME